MQHRSVFDAYSADYDQHVNQALAFTGAKVDLFTRIKAEYLRLFMEAHVDTLSKAEALDVGCGIGNCHPHVSPYLGRLCGIDVSADSIAAARENNSGVDYAHYDGVSIPYDEARFDFVFAICVFHHVPLNDRDQLVSEMRRVLRPKGFIIIFEHNPLNPLTRRVVNRCEFDRDAILLTARTSERLIEKGGFGGVETQFILNVPAVNKSLLALDRSLSKLPLGAQYYTVGRK